MMRVSPEVHQALLAARSFVLRWRTETTRIQSAKHRFPLERFQREALQVVSEVEKVLQKMGLLPIDSSTPLHPHQRRLPQDTRTAPTRNPKILGASTPGTPRSRRSIAVTNPKVTAIGYRNTAAQVPNSREAQKPESCYGYRGPGGPWGPGERRPDSKGRRKKAAASDPGRLEPRKMPEQQVQVLLATLQSQFGIQVHPGTEYAKRVRAALNRRFTEGATSAQLLQVIAAAVRDRKAGSTFRALSNLTYLWGPQFPALLDAVAHPPPPRTRGGREAPVHRTGADREAWEKEAFETPTTLPKIEDLIGNPPKKKGPAS